MRGHERQSARHAAQGERGAAARGRRAGGGDAGTDAEAHAVGGEMGHLLGGAAEDGGIAALQPHHALARPGGGEQQVVDALLRLAVPARSLADADLFDAWRDEGEHARPDQRVIKDDVRGRDEPFRLARQKVGIARPRPHQPDVAGRDKIIRLHEGSPDGFGPGYWRWPGGRSRNWCRRPAPCRQRARRPTAGRGWQRRSG